MFFFKSHFVTIRSGTIIISINLFLKHKNGSLNRMQEKTTTNRKQDRPHNEKNNYNVAHTRLNTNKNHTN